MPWLHVFAVLLLACVVPTLGSTNTTVIAIRGGKNASHVTVIINNADIFTEETIPEWKKQLDFTATVILTVNTIFMMSGMGCATYWKQVVNHAWPPTGILIGMVGQFIFLPAMGSGMSYLFSLTRYEAMGVLLVSCSPGGSMSNFFAYWMDGDLALSIVMTTFSSVLAFVGMPFNLWLYSKIWITADENHNMVIPYSSIMTALVFITIPVAIGMVIRHFNERIAAIITKVTSIISWVGVVLVIIIWIILHWRVFITATPLIYLSALLLPVLGFSIAYGFALLLCRTHKVCRTIGIETGSQNMMVALSIIILSFEESEMKSSILLFPTLYGLIIMVEMFIAIGVFQGWKKHTRNRKKNYPEEHQATVENSKELQALTSTIT